VCRIAALASPSSLRHGAATLALSAGGHESDQRDPRARPLVVHLGRLHLGHPRAGQGGRRGHRRDGPAPLWTHIGPTQPEKTKPAASPMNKTSEKPLVKWRRMGDLNSRWAYTQTALAEPLNRSFGVRGHDPLSCLHRQQCFLVGSRSAPCQRVWPHHGHTSFAPADESRGRWPSVVSVLINLSADQPASTPQMAPTCGATSTHAPLPAVPSSV
jgi:hypothetical protein